MGCFKERSKLHFGDSLLQLQTLTSIFGIETVLIGTVTIFLMVRHKSAICDIQEMYIFRFNQVHQMLIGFHLITRLIGVYMGQV